jgi:hypothetical protein
MNINDLDFSEEKMNRFRNEYILKLKEEKEKYEKFYKSGKFQEILDIVKKHDRIDDDALLYKTANFDGLVYDDFYMLVTYIFKNFDFLEITDPSCEFPRTFIDYEGVRFYLVVGQGSSYWTELITNDAKTISRFELEGVKKGYAIRNYDFDDSYHFHKCN